MDIQIRKLPAFYRHKTRIPGGGRYGIADNLLGQIGPHRQNGSDTSPQLPLFMNGHKMPIEGFTVDFRPVRQHLSG